MYKVNIPVSWMRHGFLKPSTKQCIVFLFRTILEGRHETCFIFGRPSSFFGWYNVCFFLVVSFCCPGSLENKVDGKADERSFFVFKPHKSSKYDFDGEFHGDTFRKLLTSNTLDGQNPANQLRLVVYSIIYDGFQHYLDGGCLGFLNHQQ